MDADRMQKTAEKQAGNATGAGAAGLAAGVVARFVAFQATGVGFDAVWADIGQIIEECIAAVPDPLVRAVVTPLLAGPCSVRECARDLSLSESMVQRRRTTAYELLRPMLETRGIEPACG